MSGYVYKKFFLDKIESERTQRWLCMLAQPFFVCASNRNRGRDTFCVLYMIETDGFGNNETMLEPNRNSHSGVLT